MGKADDLLDMLEDVAGEILKQIGGNQLIAMTGAKNFLKDKDSLTFSIPRAGKGINKVQIKLTPNDLYTVTFWKIHGTKMTKVSEHEDIYNDQLRGLFERETGLRTSMTKTFS